MAELVAGLVSRFEPRRGREASRAVCCHGLRDLPEL